MRLDDRRKLEEFICGEKIGVESMSSRRIVGYPHHKSEAKLLKSYYL